MIPTTAVFDASALLRAVVKPHEAAIAWVDALAEGRVRAWAPELVFAELANALAGYVRTGVLGDEDAGDVLRSLLDLPLNVESLGLLAVPALGFALTRGGSAYDGCYLALAIGHDAVLVTADRRLAQRADRVALLPEVGPPA